jgi:heterodisulfide reductase subunit C
MGDAPIDYLNLHDPSFLRLINEMSQQEIQRCYQCVKCTSGCPIAEAMDYSPNQILKLVQLGLKEEVLTSSTIWLCASCETCAVRCPMQLDIAKVMDSLREMAVKEGFPASERQIFAFHDEFLSNVRESGRINEFHQLIRYKVKTKDFFSDIGLGMRMLAKGRLALKPKKVERTNEIKAIFDEFGA